MLTFSVIEIAAHDGYSILRVQVGSDSLDAMTGDVFNVAVAPDIALLNNVGSPLVVERNEDA
jgi:hypothetical protein